MNWAWLAASVGFSMIVLALLIWYANALLRAALAPNLYDELRKEESK